MRRLTSRTTGASSVTSRRWDRSSSSSAVSRASDVVSSTSASTRWLRSMAEVMHDGVDTTTRTSALVIDRMSSTATTFDGSAMATTRSSPSHDTGSAV
jgi:hypothetical protein